MRDGLLDDEHPSGRISGVPAINLATRSFQLIATHMAFESIRGKLLEEIVFSRKDGTKSLRTDDLSYRKILLDIESHKICVILWKESIFLPSENLPLGAVKFFPDKQITQHGLAVALSKMPGDVSRLNKVIQNVVNAGSNYNLIEKSSINNTKSFICGTILLHEFMQSLGSSYEKILSDLAVSPLNGNGGG